MAAIPPSPEENSFSIFTGDYSRGTLTGKQLALNLNDDFTPEAVADFQKSLAPLGEPLSIQQTSHDAARRNDISRIRNCIPS